MRRILSAAARVRSGVYVRGRTHEAYDQIRQEHHCKVYCGFVQPEIDE
jgi:hypothetical protein